jgi:hypothetical protein
MESVSKTLQSVPDWAAGVGILLIVTAIAIAIFVCASRLVHTFTKHGDGFL